MVDLFERLDDFLVSINNYPYYRTEIIDKNRGIVRIYGRDGDKEKINYVTYSKDHYNKDYIEDNILSKYDGCPLCIIGQKLYVPPRKDSSKDIKTPVVMLSLIGMLSVPFFLYIVKKKLTKPGT